MVTTGHVPLTGIGVAMVERKGARPRRKVGKVSDEDLASRAEQLNRACFDESLSGLGGAAHPLDPNDLAVHSALPELPLPEPLPNGEPRPRLKKRRFIREA
jgi:hypothetical protein